MAGEPEVFDAESNERIARVVEWAERMMRVPAFGPRGDAPVVQEGGDRLVSIASTTATGGYYPANLVEQGIAAGCWFRKANTDDVVTTGRTYHMRRWGLHDDGSVIYSADVMPYTTWRAVLGSPGGSYDHVVTVSLDNTHSYWSLTSPAANEVRVDIFDATPSRWGLVNNDLTAPQTFAGNKYFQHMLRVNTQQIGLGNGMFSNPPFSVGASGSGTWGNDGINASATGGFIYCHEGTTQIVLGGSNFGSPYNRQVLYLNCNPGDAFDSSSPDANAVAGMVLPHRSVVIGGTLVIPSVQAGLSGETFHTMGGFRGGIRLGMYNGCSASIAGIGTETGGEFTGGGSFLAFGFGGRIADDEQYDSLISEKRTSLRLIDGGYGSLDGGGLLLQNPVGVSGCYAIADGGGIHKGISLGTFGMTFVGGILTGYAPSGANGTFP